VGKKGEQFPFRSLFHAKQHKEQSCKVNFSPLRLTFSLHLCVKQAHTINPARLSGAIFFIRVINWYIRWTRTILMIGQNIQAVRCIFI